jgi:DUF3102 family protein
MTSSKKGAASAAPTLNELANGIRADLAGIAGDNRSVLAHAIAAGKKLNQAKAQLGHGEWLPWLEKNFSLSQQTASEYMRLANYGGARNFSSISEALAAIKKPGKRRPRRAGLATNPDVVEWVEARLKEGMTREEIRAASAKDNGYPGKKGLTSGGLTAIYAVLDDRKQRPAPKRKGPTWGGKRKRQVYEEIREKGETRLRRLQVDIADAVMKLEHMELPEDIGLSDEEQDDISMLYDSLTTLSEWTERALIAVMANMDDMTRRRKIKKLQDRARDVTSTENERRVAALAAERLEVRRRELAG